MKTHLKTCISGLAGLAFAAGAFASGSSPIRLHTALDHALLDARGDHHAVLKIALEPIHYPSRMARAPIDLAIVIDKSGSMTGDRIDMARRAAAQAVEALRPGDRVTVIAYNERVDTIVPLTPVERLADALHRIQRIEASGYTAIYAGVNRAAEELRRGEARPGRALRIALLSDGQANVGPASPPEFRRLGQSLAAEGMAVSTIGLGLGFNEDLMAALASGSQGNVYFAERPSDLPRIFEAELNAAGSLMARRAVIEIVCPPGFKPVAIIGREGTISGQRVTLEINQLYAGQEKFALIEIACPAGRPSQPQTVAIVEARIQMVEGDAEVQLQATAEAAYASNEDDRSNSVNVAVQRAVVENRIAIAQEEAILLADAGKPAAAAATFRDLNVWIESANANLNDDQIATQNLELQQRAEQIEREGLDTRARKELRSSSYQKYNQQKAK